MEQILQNPYMFFALAVWELCWKGVALWVASKNNQKYWFVAILVLNTVGVLPIVYLLYQKYYRRKSGK